MSAVHSPISMPSLRRLRRKDSKSITDARTHLSALKAMTSTDAAAAIARLLELINALQSVSIDTTAARRDADRLLVWWQSRA